MATATTTETLVIFDEADQKRQADVRNLLSVCDDETEGAKLQTELIKLNKKEKTAKAQRGTTVSELFKKLSSLKVEFSELFQGEAPLFTDEQAKTYAQSKGWLKVASKKQGKKTTDESEGNEQREPVTIGMFKTKDFPEFVVPLDDKNKPEVAPEFTWELFKRYGPTANNKFIQAIKAKGYEFVVKQSNDDFKVWLTVSKETTVGRGANKPNHPNFRDFMKAFKVMDADTAEANYKTVEAVLLKAVEKKKKEAEAQAK